MIYYYAITCFIPNLIFFHSATAKTCSGGLVLFGCGMPFGGWLETKALITWHSVDINT